VTKNPTLNVSTLFQGRIVRNETV